VTLKTKKIRQKSNRRLQIGICLQPIKWDTLQVTSAAIHDLHGTLNSDWKLSNLKRLTYVTFFTLHANQGDVNCYCSGSEWVQLNVQIFFTYQSEWMIFHCKITLVGSVSNLSSRNRRYICLIVSDLGDISVSVAFFSFMARLMPALMNSSKFTLTVL